MFRSNSSCTVTSLVLAGHHEADDYLLVRSQHHLQYARAGPIPKHYDPAVVDVITPDIVRTPAFDLILDLACDLEIVRDLGRPNDIARVIVSARTLANSLNSVSARAWRGQRGAGRVAPLAGRMLAAAARLLPAGDRARYAEEFRSELTEIARTGAGRPRQLVYAARVVMSAQRLRADLRAPRRRRAAL